MLGAQILNQRANLRVRGIFAKKGFQLAARIRKKRFGNEIDRCGRSFNV
jgi:hypothetical protein